MKSILAKIYTPIPVMIASILNIDSAFAANDVCSSSASSEVKKAAGCSGSSDALPNIIINILNAIIGIAGIISVIWIIIGGINYMTSSGDSTKTKKARDTILYACIGLIICVLSFAIVNFVIINILKAN
ncbi:hypothetical protein IKD67_04105 [Candidatus Saccharibacteria bacterium]|nr:hypothetical protein [Candidatus Saccharibacteria bacterium]